MQRTTFSRVAPRATVLWVFALAVTALLVPSTRADAHPLGNFTINRYARVEPSAGLLRVTYVLDQAEIPTFQEQGAIDQDREGFARRRADEIAGGLRLTVDSAPVALHRVTYLLSEPEGQGGLPTLRLAIIFEAPVSGTQQHDAVFADRNEPNRIGWREIVVHQVSDARVMQSTAPSSDLSHELLSYPANLIQAPLDLRQVTFRFMTGTAAVPAEHLTTPARGPVRSGSDFSALVQTVHLGPAALVVMFGLALSFGAVHALAPGHGKSVMAAYLVGTRGRPIDALLLGLIVAVMHTGSVLAVGFALMKLGSDTDIAKVYPVLTLASGLTVFAVGIFFFTSRLRALLVHNEKNTHAHGLVADNTEADVAHQHDHDDHTHEQHHHGPGGHTHELPEGVAPLSRRGLILLGTSGGLLPSPSAVIVLISAVSINRIALGLGLIAAFSLGLAATLTTVGLSLVYGRNILERRPRSARIIRVLPLVSAVALMVAGSVVSVRGWSGI